VPPNSWRLSNLNRFSKFFYDWKESEISNKTHASFPITPKVCCLGEFRSSNFKFVANLEENADKKCHINQLFPQLSEKSHEQSLNLLSLLFCRLMKGLQTVKKHKK